MRNLTWDQVRKRSPSFEIARAVAVYCQRTILLPKLASKAATLKQRRNLGGSCCSSLYVVPIRKYAKKRKKVIEEEQASFDRRRKLAVEAMLIHFLLYFSIENCSTHSTFKKSEERKKRGKTEGAQSESLSSLPRLLSFFLFRSFCFFKVFFSTLFLRWLARSFFRSRFFSFLNFVLLSFSHTLRSIAEASALYIRKRLPSVTKNAIPCQHYPEKSKAAKCIWI